MEEILYELAFDPDNDGAPPELAEMHTCGPNGDRPCDRIYNDVDPALLAGVLGIDDSAAGDLIGTFTCGPNGDALCTAPNRTWIRAPSAGHAGTVYGNFGCGKNGDEPCSHDNGDAVVYACGPAGNEACPPGFFSYDSSNSAAMPTYAYYYNDAPPSPYSGGSGGGGSGGGGYGSPPVPPPVPPGVTQPPSPPLLPPLTPSGGTASGDTAWHLASSSGMSCDDVCGALGQSCDGAELAFSRPLPPGTSGPSPPPPSPPPPSLSPPSPLPSPPPPSPPPPTLPPGFMTQAEKSAAAGAAGYYAGGACSYTLAVGSNTWHNTAGECVTHCRTVTNAGTAMYTGYGPASCALSCTSSGCTTTGCTYPSNPPNSGLCSCRTAACANGVGTPYAPNGRTACDSPATWETGCNSDGMTGGLYWLSSSPPPSPPPPSPPPPSPPPPGTSGPSPPDYSGVYTELRAAAAATGAVDCQNSYGSIGGLAGPLYWNNGCYQSDPPSDQTCAATLSFGLRICPCSPPAGGGTGGGGGGGVAPVAGGGYSKCRNTCSYARDGDCDDGGPGSEFSTCSLGSDCTDCGTRSSAARDDFGRPGCSNTCYSKDDGDCDDGGPGSEYNLCSPATDCEDCGPRSRYPPGAARPIPPPSYGPVPPPTRSYGRRLSSVSAPPRPPRPMPPPPPSPDGGRERTQPYVYGGFVPSLMPRLLW